jgi:hypothetical protein
MSSQQSTTWFWSDWNGDQAVRRLTPAERGMWIDLLSYASVGEPPGYVCDARGAPVPVEEIARFANCSAGEAASLIDGILRKGAASRDRTGRLFNRRMVRDFGLSVKRRRAGLAGAAATALKWQRLNGVPGQLPGHVPRAPGTRPSKKKDLTSTVTGAAREGSPNGAADPPSEKTTTGIVSNELAEVMQKRGWVR